LQPIQNSLFGERGTIHSERWDHHEQLKGILSARALQEKVQASRLPVFLFQLYDHPQGVRGVAPSLAGEGHELDPNAETVACLVTEQRIEINYPPLQGQGRIRCRITQLHIEAAAGS
jgi:hypothetical protein